MTNIINALVRDNVDMLVVTTDAGSVLTAGPAHPQYELIRALVLNRTNDDELLDLLDPAIDKHNHLTTARPLIPHHPEFERLLTDEINVWIEKKSTTKATTRRDVPEALAAELLFLRQCEPEIDTAHHPVSDELYALCHFAKNLVEVKDESIRDELVGLYLKRLIRLSQHGTIFVTINGMLITSCLEPSFVQIEDAHIPLTPHIAPADITSISRRGGVRFTTT